MAKQKNNARKDGRVQVQLDIGVDPKTGNRRRKYFYGATTKEAQAKADAFKRDMENGYDAMSGDMRLDQWSDKWFEAYKCGISKTTRANYVSVFSSIYDELGHKKLRSLTQTDLQIFANSYINYSTSHIRFVRNTLNQIFVAAVDNGLLVRNPLTGVKFPTGSKGTHRALVDWEVSLIAEHWQEHRAGIWIMLMLYAGLRRGEMAALRWNDIDFKTQELHVRSAMHIENNQPVLGNTKTQAGLRSIPIVDPLFHALQATRFAKKDSPFICVSASGLPLSEAAMRRGLESFLHQMNQYSTQSFSFRFHDLRHTFATFLYDAGVDVKTAQSYLGHADVTMTMQIYTHLSDQKKQGSEEKLRDFFSAQL